MNNNQALIFDIDGALTLDQNSLDSDFKIWFLNFCIHYPVFLVTKCDRDRTLLKLGSEIYNAARTVYHNSGNDVWQGDRRIFSNHWFPEPGLIQWLENELANSTYKGIKTGDHIELRTGCLNFSTLGENATSQQRAQYMQWDQTAHQRQDIAKRLQWFFPDLEARVCGEIGINVRPRGKNKAQILRDFDAFSCLLFFVDHMSADENNYALAAATRGLPVQVRCVKNWQQIKQLLQEMYS